MKFPIIEKIVTSNPAPQSAPGERIKYPITEAVVISVPPQVPDGRVYIVVDDGLQELWRIERW